MLVREGSRGRLEELREPLGRRRGPDRPGGRRPLPGEARLRGGRSTSCRGKIDHFFHLAAIYDMTADAESQRVANVEGTREAVEARRGARRQALPHGQLDRRGRPLQGHLHRGHVRGGRERREPPLLPDQARVRGRRPRGVPRCRGGSTGPGSSSATPRPARWTRSTGPTTSSSCCSGRATLLPPVVPGRSASRAARSTSSRSTSSPRRWTTSPTATGSTARPSTSPTPTR